MESKNLLSEGSRAEMIDDPKVGDEITVRGGEVRVAWVSQTEVCVQRLPLSPINARNVGLTSKLGADFQNFCNEADHGNSAFYKGLI
ncbi:hypothetical protein JKY72_06810 [Candidatus Gracilibacteria bacterium]|nr:hypothetical protein [Candidatus Gracilibacteria bacterium]